jgi:hypothetical protein
VPEIRWIIHSDAVQSLFASDIEHFENQKDAEWRAKNHRLSEGKTFAKPCLALWYEIFDPSSGSLTKSQKLGLTASNSLRFAH